MAPTVATWAIDSTRMTPGTIGLPGKCPAWYHSLPVKVCSPTARTPGSSSMTRSINRNGSRCGMSASIAALSSVDIASESRDKEEGHPAVTLFLDRKSTRLNSSHITISYAVFCLIKNIEYDIVTHTSAYMV